MQLLLKSTITPEGYAAALNNVPNANGFRIEITKMQAVARGVPKGFTEAKGVALGPQQVSIRGTFTSTSDEYSFDEIWLYDGISNQVFVKLKRVDNGVIDFVSPYKRAIINYSISFATLPDGSVTIMADNEQSAALAELDAHNHDPNAHQELLDYLAGISIYHYTNIPTVKKGELIYVKPFGFMEWVEKWKMYRSLEAAKKRSGWSAVTKPGWVLADGATYSKNGNYKGLWTAALDAEIVLGPEKWEEGQYIFIDVDDNTFRVPSVGGTFDRNASMGSAVDAGRDVFSSQDDAMAKFTGSFQSRRFIDVIGGVLPTPGANGLFQMKEKNGPTYVPFNSSAGVVPTDTMYFDNSYATRTANENRPRNTAYPAWIKI